MIRIRKLITVGCRHCRMRCAVDRAFIRLPGGALFALVGGDGGTAFDPGELLDEPARPLHAAHPLTTKAGTISICPKPRRRTAGRGILPAVPGGPRNIMFYWAKKQLVVFQRPQVGRRFQEFNRRHHESGWTGRWWGRLMIWTVGLVLLAVGAVLLVTPGPGLLFAAAGASLLACGSRAVARLADWIDLKSRPVASWIHRKWMTLPRATRVMAQVLAAGGSAAAMVVGILLLR